jgi:hypothetical protein
MLAIVCHNDCQVQRRKIITIEAQRTHRAQSKEIRPVQPTYKNAQLYNLRTLTSHAFF